MTRGIRYWFAGIALALLAACVTTWQKPEVSLLDVRLAGGNLLQQDVKLQLRVKNPNGIDIGVNSVAFELLVGDNRLATGRMATPVMIPARGEGVVEVNAKAHLLSLVTRLPQLLNEDGLLHYRIRGEAEIQRYGSLPFDHAGTLDPERLRIPGQGGKPPQAAAGAVL
jgi:LEA14-like dessication related protein